MYLLRRVSDPKHPAFLLFSNVLCYLVSQQFDIAGSGDYDMASIASLNPDMRKALFIADHFSSKWYSYPNVGGLAKRLATRLLPKGTDLSDQTHCKSALHVYLHIGGDYFFPDVLPLSDIRKVFFFFLRKSKPQSSSNWNRFASHFVFMPLFERSCILLNKPI